MAGEAAEKRAWKHAEAQCRDVNCRAHGRMLRRIQRLARALASTRWQLELTENALDLNSDEVIRLRGQLRDDPMETPVLNVHADDMEAERVRYAAAVAEWHDWSKSGARDERGMGWDRAHTTMCSDVPCRKHRNPYMRSRG